MTDSDKSKKQLTQAQLIKKLDKKAITLVHKFIANYFNLDESDDGGHENNESKLIEGLYDIYDPTVDNDPAVSLS